MDIAWPTKPNISTIWSFTKKVKSCLKVPPAYNELFPYTSRIKSALHHPKENRKQDTQIIFYNTEFPHRFLSVEKGSIHVSILNYNSLSVNKERYINLKLWILI